jgi:type I restriction enzyme S subunit
MIGWSRARLSALLEKVIDNRGKTPPLSADGIELVETNSLTGGGKFPDYSLVRKHVSEEIFDTWFRAGHPRKGDILVATVGANIGSTAIMNEARGCVAQNLVGLRANTEKVDPDFLYYYLSWNRTRDELKRLDIGAAQPSLKVPHLLNIEIPLPSITLQSSIRRKVNKKHFAFG